MQYFNSMGVPMKRTREYVVLLVVLMLGASTAGPVFGEEITERVMEAHLSNGMKVLLLESPKTPLITFQVWYWAGSRNEPWGKSGLSHVIEHMMFKGTERTSGADFARTIEEQGGTYNAFTSQDFAGYFETVTREGIRAAIELEADRMRNIVFREEDFVTERMVVMEERRMRTDDNPQAFLSEQLEAAAYQAQPYHWPIIGWVSDLQRIRLEDVQDYYNTHYNPANAFIVVVGGFKKEDILPAIEKAFGSIPRGEAPAKLTYEDPPQTGERRIYLEKRSQLPFIIMGYHVPNIRDPDSYVLEIIAALLSAGKSSRLFEAIVRNKGLALEASAAYSSLTMDPGLFYLVAKSYPGKNIGEVEKALDQELERMRKEPVGERELQKAKNQVESAFVIQQDSLYFQAMLLAQYEIVLDWRAIADYIRAIREVSAEDVQRVTRRYLIPRNRTVAILSPVQGEVAGVPLAEPAAPDKEGPIHHPPGRKP